MLLDIIFQIIYALILISALMVGCAYSVLAERKISSWIQGRLGPNRTNFAIINSIPIIGLLIKRMGLIQPLADGLKFLFKEDPIPKHVYKFYYCLAPVIVLIPALSTIVAIPIGEFYNIHGFASPIVLANLDTGILFVFAISSLNVYGIVLGGWASNSKYSFLGGIRASAQMISYELAMGLSILPIIIWSNSPGSQGGLSIYNIVCAQDKIWFIFWQPISALIFLVSLFAETNRLPFDMAESETDLVGGFHTEYGSFKFGLFFVAEYAHIIIGSALFVILFFGGWYFLPGIPNPWPLNAWGALLSLICFLLKVIFFIFFFIWVRWTVPRFRYDQVMELGWNTLIPISIFNLIFYTIIIAFIDKF